MSFRAKAWLKLCWVMKYFSVRRSDTTFTINLWTWFPSARACSCVITSVSFDGAIRQYLLFVSHDSYLDCFELWRHIWSWNCSSSSTAHGAKVNTFFLAIITVTRRGTTLQNSGCNMELVTLDIGRWLTSLLKVYLKVGRIKIVSGTWSYG